jgi:hypothetical protein
MADSAAGCISPIRNIFHRANFIYATLHDESAAESGAREGAQLRLAYERARFSEIDVETLPE